MAKKDMNSGFKICSELKVKEKCFRLQIYDQGEVKELFHEHVPKYRISSPNAVAFMKALIIKYSSLRDPEILKTYLNSKAKEPSAINLCKAHIEYPEPGVFRKYFSGGDITAWVDEVVSPNEFRRKD
jgi:hypothetical protein